MFWILGGNRSGKSATGARAVSWWFNGDHPHMDRPAEWGAGPLQILVVGRLGEQMESELWERKLKPFMREGEYRAVRIGNILQRVIHLKTGNRILFLSHHDAKNAREKVQAFTSHVVWLDEMPDDAGLVTELVMRVLANRGRLYGTFTPLIRNHQIKKIVDAPTPTSRKVQLSILDNPTFDTPERRAEITQTIRAACSSESEFRARMYGDWYEADGRVFVYDADQHRGPVPNHYDPQHWRHLAVLDPAASGMAGLTVWGEDPLSGRWFNVLARYVKGAAAFDLYATVEGLVRGFGRLQRWCDCNPAGFYKESTRRAALGQGAAWRPYTDKNDRKLETIDKTNAAFAQGRVQLTEDSGLLDDELVSAMWSGRAVQTIVNASRLHLADSMRYAVDLFPAWDGSAVAAPRTPTQDIREAWKRRLATKAKAAAQAARITQRRGAWRRHS